MIGTLRNGLVFGALPFVIVASPASAQLVIGAEAHVQAASNPLLLAGGDRSALMGEISVMPEYKTESATGDSFDLAGVLTERRYSRLYSNYVLGSVRATGEVRQDEHFTARATAAYVRDLAGDTLASNIDGLASPQSVRNSWQGELSATWRPDPRTMIVPLVSGERSTFDTKSLPPGTTPLQNTTSARAEIGVRRLITESVWLGIKPVADMSRTNGQPSLHRLALFGTVNKRFSSTINLEVDAGVEHVDGANAVGLNLRREPATSFSGSFSLCHTGETTNSCLNGSIGSDVSALFGFQRRKAVGANISKRLDERRTITVQLDYQHVSAPTNVPLFRSANAATARVTLDWRLSQRATLSGELQYARRTIDSGDKPQSGYVGLRFRWQPHLR